MSFCSKWNPILRWILFIPSFWITYFIANFLFNISVGRYFGPYDENSIISFIFYHSQNEIINIGVAIIISSICAPRGHVIIASVYGGIILLFIGFSWAIYLVGYSNFPLWQMIISSLTSIGGIIVGIAGTVYFEKNNRKKIVEYENT